MAVAGLAVVVSNKVLVESKEHPKSHKIMLLECKFRNFIKFHFLQVVATWVAAADLAKVAVAADLVRVVVAVDLVRVAAAADLVKAAVDLVKGGAVDLAKAAAVDLVRVAAVVDLVAGAKVAAGAKRSV